MGAHAEFIFRLVNLVEYAEQHDLEVASLALNAAVEVIAPSIAHSIFERLNTSRADAQRVNGQNSYGPHALTPRINGQHQHGRPLLRVITGGRGLAEAC